MRTVISGLGLSLGLASVLLVGPLAHAQERAPSGPTTDLLDVYEMAVEQDPRLRAARSRMRASDELGTQARAAFLPEIRLEADGGRTREYFEPENLPDTTSSYTDWNAGVTLVQPLFRMESFAAADEAELIQDESALRYAQAQQAILLRVSEAYFDVLLAQETVILTEAELEAIETELQRARRALDVGAGTVTAVDEAQAQYDLVRAQRLEAQNDLRVARETLRRLVGRPVDDLARLRDDFQAQPPAPEDPKRWSERAERNNLDVRLAETQFDRSRTQVRSAEAQRYPRIDLVARYGRGYQSEPGGQLAQQPEPAGSFETETARIGVQLSMPLFTGGANTSRIREAQAERDAVFDDAVDSRRDAGLEAESAYLNLSSNLQRIRALEQALRSIENTERSTRRGLEVGLRTTLDVLNVQSERFQTERDLAAARYGYLLNYLQLQVAVGSGIDGSAVEDVNFFLTGSMADMEPEIMESGDPDLPGTPEDLDEQEREELEREIQQHQEQTEPDASGGGADGFGIGE